MLERLRQQSNPEASTFRGQALIRFLEKQERAILNIKACLEACGLTFDNILTRRIYIIPMEDFRKVIAVWDKYVQSSRWVMWEGRI
jgi:enamine deaminase RidA (YjgF/YER057c/UK114 family)